MTPPFEFSDKSIQSAIDNAAPIFDSLNTHLDSVSQDIKNTEEYLREKGVVGTFCFNLTRHYKHADIPENMSGAIHETLDWRWDPKSKKFRLMVSTYNLNEKIKDTLREKEIPFELINSKPLIESPIKERIFYHDFLSRFINSMAESFNKHIKKGERPNGIICIWHWIDSGPGNPAQEYHEWAKLPSSEIKDDPKPKPPDG